MELVESSRTRQLQTKKGFNRSIEGSRTRELQTKGGSNSTGNGIDKRFYKWKLPEQQGLLGRHNLDLLVLTGNGIKSADLDRKQINREVSRKPIQETSRVEKYLCLLVLKSQKQGF